MSLASYIGCNVEIPISEEDLDEFMILGDCFSNKEQRINVKKYQFTTPYVYEISSDWGIEISKDVNTEINTESKEKLIALCNIMNTYIEEGDFFELYSCWVGEETDKRENEITLKINNFDSDQVEIPEKTLVRFEK